MLVRYTGTTSFMDIYGETFIRQGDVGTLTQIRKGRNGKEYAEVHFKNDTKLIRMKKLECLKAFPQN